jgi:hypothetical protein
MEDQPTSMPLAERRDTVSLAAAALQGLASVLWQAPGPELGPLLGQLDDLARAAEAARVVVLEEALVRGEAQTSPAGPPKAWVEHWAPSFRAGGAARLVEVTVAMGKPVHEPLRTSVVAGRCGVASAAVVIAELARLHHRLVPAAVPTVLAGLVQLAEGGRPADIRRLRPRLLAEHGAMGELQAEQEAAKRLVALSHPVDESNGTWAYRLVLDPEGHATLEAALGPLSAPRPADGDPDLRGSDQRRGEALIELVRRAVAAADGVPTTAKTELMLTMDYQDLAAGLGAATTVGGPAAGTLLAPETVRRLACDAALIPAVLGSAGQVLEMGRATRWYTPAQARILWRRDGGCTFPECSMPPHWTDAHHLWHWTDGGPTDTSWAALLCGRHHTMVHIRRLHGQVIDGAVHWDLTTGSYDHWLQNRPPSRQ